MRGLPQREDIIRRSAIHIRRSGDRDEVHLLWKGYVQALWEWHLVDRSLRDRLLLRFKPVGNAELEAKFLYVPRSRWAKVFPFELQIALVLLRHTKTHGRSDKIMLLWHGYLAALREWGLINRCDDLSALLRDVCNDDLAIVYAGYLDEQSATGSEFHPRVSSHLRRRPGSEFVRVLWHGYFHALADLDMLSQSDPIDIKGLIGEHPVAWHERLIVGPRDATGFERLPTREELANEIDKSLSANGDTELIHLLWKGYLAAWLEWERLDREDHRILNGTLRSAGNDELAEMLDDIASVVPRADIVLRGL